MDFDDDTISEEVTEAGSAEFLSDDNLSLPTAANPLVRLHAVLAWFTRRQKVTNIEIGEAALELQELQQDESGSARLRRRELQVRQEQMQYLQQRFQQAQERLEIYGTAESLLKERLDQTTVGGRLLVDSYFMLE